LIYTFSNSFLTLRYFLGFISLILLVACSDQNNYKNFRSLFVKSKPPHPLQSDLDSIVNLIARSVDSAGCPGFAITVVVDSTTIALKSFGVKEANTSELINDSTLFRIGSVSKGFAGLLAYKLAKEGFFSLEDPVIKYLPEFTLKDKAHSSKLKIRHLLSQSTGLTPHAYTNLIEDGLSLNEIIPYFKTLRPKADTGVACTYQNASFAMIEPIIFNTTGKSYEQLLKEKIFDPLQLQASTGREAFHNNINKTKPHIEVSQNLYQAIPYNDKYYTVASAGGVNMSISDMVKYLKVYLGSVPELMTKSDLDEFFKPRVASGFEVRGFDRWEHSKSSHYAYGWRIIDYDNTMWSYHGGYVNA
jgi:beta-lactamase class C